MALCKFLKFKYVRMDVPMNNGKLPAELASDLDTKWFLENRFTNETHPFTVLLFLLSLFVFFFH